MSNSNLISTNFSLLRHLSGRHEDLVNKLNGLITWTQLSEYALGKSIPSNSTLDEVELILSLPQGWTRRDNISLLHLTEGDYEMLKCTLGLTPSVRKSLSDLIFEISSIQNGATNES